MKVRISNIQRFCLHDGPGIRTTIFFKGCQLHCPWCCNPENINFEINKNNSKELLGIDIDLEDLYIEVMKDKDFYINNGGITLSGGEALLQIEKYEELLKKLKKDKINICLETSLAANKRLLDIAIKYIDFYYIDVKILEKKKAKKMLNLDVDEYLNNLNYLISKRKNIVLRFPINKEYTYSKENIKLIKQLLKENPSLKIEIFKTHNLGKSKYEKLNLKYIEIEEDIDDIIKEVEKEFLTVNNNVKTIEI